MKKWLKGVLNWICNWFWLLIICAVLIMCGILVGSCVKDQIEYDKWWSSLTAEEKAEVNAQAAAEREKYISRYEVVSVTRYIRENTNGFGGVVSRDVAYSFNYISGDKLYTVKDFVHYDYGLTKVTIGSKDMYIVDSIDGSKYLQLTKETLQNLTKN